MIQPAPPVIAIEAVVRRPPIRPHTGAAMIRPASITGFFLPPPSWSSSCRSPTRRNACAMTTWRQPYELRPGEFLVESHSAVILGLDCWQDAADRRDHSQSVGDLVPPAVFLASPALRAVCRRAGTIVRSISSISSPFPILTITGFRREVWRDR